MDKKTSIVIRCIKDANWRMMAFSAIANRCGFLFAASVNARAQCVFDVQVHPDAQQIVIRPNAKEFPFCINFN